jgi:hypothetical protein
MLRCSLRKPALWNISSPLKKAQPKETYHHPKTCCQTEWEDGSIDEATARPRD